MDHCQKWARYTFDLNALYWQLRTAAGETPALRKNSPAAVSDGKWKITLEQN
jgi:hypothetical protein